MFRRTFLEATGSLTTAAISTGEYDGPHRDLDHESQSWQWVRDLLRDRYDLERVDWVRFEDAYRIPADRERATTILTVLNALVDGPYQRDKRDCEEFTMQLCSLVGRVGLNAGIAISEAGAADGHAWIVQPTADGEIVDWEPQTATDVSSWTVDRYDLEAGHVLL